MTQFCALFLGIYALLTPQKGGAMALWSLQNTSLTASQSQHGISYSRQAHFFRTPLYDP